MKGIVLHHERTRTYVLGEDGVFRRVKGMGNRSVAESVELPRAAPRLAVLFLSVAVVTIVALVSAFAFAFSVGAYYLCVDVNPSVEVSFNIFNRFVSARALDPEGTAILEGLSLKGYPEDVARALLRQIAEYEYMTGEVDGRVEVCLTIVGRNESSCADLERRLQPLLTDAGRRNSIVLDSCGFDVRDRAEALGVSSGALLWAERLRQYDEDIPLSDILEMPASDIAESVRSHGGP